MDLLELDFEEEAYYLELDPGYANENTLCLRGFLSTMEGVQPFKDYIEKRGRGSILEILRVVRPDWQNDVDMRVWDGESIEHQMAWDASQQVENLPVPYMWTHRPYSGDMYELEDPD